MLQTIDRPGGTTHIIGAGLAGLAAAVTLSGKGRKIALYEAAPHAGGRCRSYFEPALGMMIDNGNHLVLSGNTAAFAYLDAIGAREKVFGPPRADFSFADLKSGARWTLQINNGLLPWWVFVPSRRVPGSRPHDYFALARLLMAGANQPIGAVMACSGDLYDRLWHPILLAALNTDPAEASAGLAAQVIKETLARGGRACRPMIAAEGLAAAFVDPGLQYLGKRGVVVQFGMGLKHLDLGPDRVRGLVFGEETIELAAGDHIILAVPASVAGQLVPGLSAPNAFRAIVNAHFKIAPPPDFPKILGVLNATTEWIFAFDNRLSVTISGADRLIETPRAEIARTVWSEVAHLAGLDQALPPWQIIKERRATFAATPEQNARRPRPETAWANLTLAGDWTATGLPATIEGAIRSGIKAAACVTRDASGAASPAPAQRRL